MKESEGKFAEGNVLVDSALFYVHACFACVGVGAPFACSAHGRQRMGLDLLYLKLLMVAGCHVDAVNQTWVLYKGS